MKHPPVALRRPLAASLIAVGLAFTIQAPGAAQDDRAASPGRFEVHFASNSSALSPEGRNILAQVSAIVAQRGLTRVMVTGHADSVGTEVYNLALSRKRAQAVVAELRNLGLPAGILFADWKGEYVPAESGENETPSAPNRRVSIELPDQR